MKCHKCDSKAYSIDAKSTNLDWMPRYDSDGKLHDHNPNKHTLTFECVKNHRWEEVSYQKCPTCSYNDVPPIVEYVNT